MTLDEALTQLHRAIAGDDPGFAPALAAARDASGVPDDEVPAYLPRAIATLAERTSPPEPIAGPSERGFAWLLADFAPLLPSAQLIDDGARDGLAVPALGRALVIHRGDDERWEVIAWPPAPAAGRRRVLGTFDPSPEQVRAWAHDPDLAFTDQDEALAVTHPAHLEALVGFAADPGCPKRAYILSILDAIVALPRPDGLALMARARVLARATGDPALAAWAGDLDRVLAYAGGRGPVSHHDARAIAGILLVGRRRPALVLDESTADGWWQFRARFPDGRALDAIYVHAASGNVVWARDALALSELAPHEAAATRLAALGG
jgi:hypothetical protein